MAGVIPFDVAGAAIQIYKDNKMENEPSTSGSSQMVCKKKNPQQIQSTEFYENI